jgi:hypothetical protein
VAGAGTYRLPDDTHPVVLTVEGGRLYLSHPAFGKVELLPESASTLFMRDDGTRITVQRANGRVTALVAFGERAVRQGG